MKKFGGDWTRDKLDMLQKYLDAYTTALKTQPFRLIYIDAFAGTGFISIRDKDEDAKSFIEGSALIAEKIDNRPFDELLLVEKDIEQYTMLSERTLNDKRIRTYNRDANDFLQNLDRNWKQNRGVLFLDPFATEIEWSTIEKVASFKALDTWILFPVMAVSRMLQRGGMPNDQCASVLDRVYGNDTWKTLYKPRKDLWGDSTNEREKGANKLIQIYKDRLRDLYGERFMERSASLSNSTNAQLFELMFCVGHPSASRLAKKIAGHIVDHQQRTPTSPRR